jgi:beta-mannosidase
VVLWCGGNEFSPGRNAPLVAAMRRAVTEEDGSRPFLPVSPGQGDAHNWKVWHEFQPAAAYRRDRAAFASEFGLQAPPDLEALRRFLAQGDVWPPCRAWTYHGAGLPKLWRYARPFLPGPASAQVRPRWSAVTPEAFIRASQQAQAHGLQVAIEHFRRRKAAGCGGVLVWQLNEPWPAISWSLVDHYRQPKPAFETVQRLFRPVLVSLDYPLKEYAAGEPFCADVWVVNDLPTSLSDCQIEAWLESDNELPAARFSGNLDVAADSAQVVSHLSWTLPEAKDWRAACTLTRGGQVVAWNEYDLTLHDGIGPTPSQRLTAWLKDLFFHL